ncbi:hypothetical protein CKO51_23605 [Rhodopirellula sp. SM50]|nr:hypothetical protein CKO51_23605 [Rhodopirellula sp. SM50]
MGNASYSSKSLRPVTLQEPPATFAGLFITGGTTPTENPCGTGVAVDFGGSACYQVGFFGFCRRIKRAKP